MDDYKNDSYQKNDETKKNDFKLLLLMVAFLEAEGRKWDELRGLKDDFIPSRDEQYKIYDEYITNHKMDRKNIRLMPEDEMLKHSLKPETVEFLKNDIMNKVFANNITYPGNHVKNEEYYGNTTFLDHWDLMDSGNYNDGGFRPCGYSGFERMMVGWLTPTELKEETRITDMEALASHEEAYIIYNDAYKDEYYIVENRQKVGWDEPLPGSGIIIFHVNFRYFNNFIDNTIS